MSLRVSIALAGATLLAGCSIPIAPYAPTYDNVKLLQVATGKAKVAPFTASNSGVKSISVRGSSLASPYNADLVNYLETALKQEMEKAGILDSSSTKEVSAVIEQNDIDTNSASTGTGTIVATFKVKRQDSVLYDKRIRIDDLWKSSFIGAIAIPNAAERYPKMVEKLLNQLFSDRDFITALSQ